jgi:hypothetical protein
VTTTTLNVPATSVRGRTTWLLALAALLVFRLLFGLSSEFFFEDETQIFLMGLRYHATGAWPYFGADIVWTKSEIPGGLLPLLVGVPLNIAPVPEASYVLLNILSFGALAWFAWYVTERIPSAPKWLVWGWLMTCPWTLQFSTHILNPSYMLAADLAFFVAFFEAIPIFRLGKMSVPLAFFVMGLAITWVMQIHMSWPLLLPYALLAWISGWRCGLRALAANGAAFGAGLLLSGSLLIPTLLTYGVHGGSGGTLRNFQPHVVGPWMAVTTLARFLSFASLEIARFIAIDSAKRLMFLIRHWWLAPFAGAALVIGIWQPIWMLREWFRTSSRFREWRPLKWLVAGTVVMLYGSFWFVMEPPQAHNFYPVAPIAFMFAAYCWTFVDTPRWRRIAAVVLAINIAYHAGLAWAQAPDRSLYKNREVVAAAVRLKQPEMVGHRRPFAIDAGPYALADPSRAYNAPQDIQFLDVTRVDGPFNMSLWRFTLTNRNNRVAFRDVLYQTTYRDEAGRVVEKRSDHIKDIFQPGETRALELNDGFVRTPFASASLIVLDAEALLPMTAIDETTDSR